MMLKRAMYSIFFYTFCVSSIAQEVPADLKITKIDSTSFIADEVDILAPSKAAFYSAILPGMGQMFNKKYWKAPIVWGTLGTSVYFYIDNNKKHNRFREAFKLEIAGRPHEFDGSVEGNPTYDKNALERAQTVFKKNRDLSLFITIGLYILNIIEANVDAHLPDKALNTNISFQPAIFTVPTTNQTGFGARVSFNF
ncbi:MAG TPA: hypothetical protein DDZ39_03540 [Flavobacteriaceae bacterium]|jgi:hypothetical protein|nr:hypothetical protein [Flavobacteriaceae bacterium]HBS11681.1 hypothetical protein [Flavobacteriaceae bacterium]